nr:putative ribonuclease H protein [Ipomoea batatas]
MHVVPLWQSQGGGPLPDISEDFGAWLARRLLNDDTVIKLKCIALLWSIWRERNNLVWSRKPWHVPSIHLAVSRLLNDWQEADSTMPGNNSLASPPMHAMIIPDDGVAMYVDAAVFPEFDRSSEPAPAAKRAREEDIGDPRALKCQYAALKQKRPPTTSGELSFFFDEAGVQSSNSVHLCSCCS